MQHPYADVNPFYTQPPHFFPPPLRPRKKPSISFCPAYARGICKQGDSCALHHIDTPTIICKHYIKNNCKFGELCLFKHPPKPDEASSDLSPVVQLIVQENLSLLERLTAAEEKIRLLESVVCELQAVHSSTTTHHKLNTPPKIPCPRPEFLQQQQPTTQLPTQIKSPLLDIPIKQHKHQIRGQPKFQLQLQPKKSKNVKPSEPPKLPQPTIICANERTISCKPTAPPLPPGTPPTLGISSPVNPNTSQCFRVGQKLKSIYFVEPVILLITNTFRKTWISSGPIYSAIVLDPDPSKRLTLDNLKEEYLLDSYATYQQYPSS